MVNSGKIRRIGICFSLGQIWVCLWYSLTGYVSGSLAASVMAFHFISVYVHWQALRKLTQQ